jgi:Tol biopolymer transport system component
MNADGSGVTQLTQVNDPPVAGIRWSPDGKQVAYSMGSANGWGQITAIHIDGTDRREIATGDPTKGNNAWLTSDLIGWSQDEQSIYFEYQTGDGTWYILKADANGANKSQEIASGYALVEGLYVNGWLGSDPVLSYITQEQGTSHGSRLQNTQNGKSVAWDSLVICGYIKPNSSLNIYSGSYPITNWAVSKTGSQVVLAVSCSNKGYSEIYSLDPTTSAINKIAQIPTIWSEIKTSWSADDQLVLIQGSDKFGKTEIYLLNAEDLQKGSPITPTLIWSGDNIKAFLEPDVFNATTTAQTSTAVPTLQPTPSSPPLWAGTSKGDLMAFVSNRTGNADIYIAKSDGSDATNLTDRPADDFDPVWSPDGNWLAFSSGFNGNYSLHVMRPDGSGEKKISDALWNYSWSPDSKKIATLDILPDNPSDAYSPAKVSLKIIDLDGNILQNTSLGVYNQAGQLHWSQDGKSIFYVASKMISTPTGEMKTTESDLFQLRQESDSPIILIKSGNPIDAWTGQPGDLTYLLRNIDGWDLVQNSGGKQKKLATWGFGEIQCSTSANPVGRFTWNYGSETAIKTWSPDSKYILFQLACDNGETRLYLGGLNGKFFKLSDYPVQDLSRWSPDSKNILFVSDPGATGNLDIYKLNVEPVIQDPSAAPFRLTTSGFDEYSPVMQPKP